MSTLDIDFARGFLALHAMMCLALFVCFLLATRVVMEILTQPFECERDTKTNSWCACISLQAFTFFVLFMRFFNYEPFLDL